MISFATSCRTQPRDQGRLGGRGPLILPAARITLATTQAQFGTLHLQSASDSELPHTALMASLSATELVSPALALSFELFLASAQPDPGQADLSNDTAESTLGCRVT